MVYFWTLTYALAFFGSVSFGYLIMRFGMPDTRILPKQIKLGVASITGFVLFAISALIAYFLFTPIYLYATLPAITALALFFIQMRDMFFAPKTVKIAIPVARVTQATTSTRRFETPAPIAAKAASDAIKEAAAFAFHAPKPMAVKPAPMKGFEAPAAVKEVIKSVARLFKPGVQAPKPAASAPKPAPMNRFEARAAARETAKPVTAGPIVVEKKIEARHKKAEPEPAEAEEKKPIILEEEGRREKRRPLEEPITLEEEEKKPLTTFVSRMEEPRAAERVETIQEKMERAVEAPERIYAHGEERAKEVELESPYARPQRTEEKPAPGKPAHARAVLFGKEPSASVSAEPAKVTPSAAERPSFNTASASDSRHDRYSRRRGDLVEQAKVDMTKPVESQAPLPIISDEEINLETGEGLDLSDLQSISDLGELSLEEGLVGLESSDVSLGDLAGLSEIENVPKEKGMSCPHCGSKNATIVYCPYCGKGLCSNCADLVHSEGNLTFYGCPTCKKEVIVKKE